MASGSGVQSWFVKDADALINHVVNKYYAVISLTQYRQTNEKRGTGPKSECNYIPYAMIEISKQKILRQDVENPSSG